MENSDKPPPSRQVVVRSVWSGNLESEFCLIRSVIDSFPVVSMDTEFPGVVVRPSKDEPNFRQRDPTAHYSSLKANVDMLNLIQIGLTLSDEDGNLPDLGTDQVYIWEFNFRDFDVARDNYAPDSVELLRRQGIDFERNQECGIDSYQFAELMMSSGLVLSDDKTKTMKLYIKTLACPLLSPFQNPNFKFSQSSIPSTNRLPFSSSTPRFRRFNLTLSSCSFISGNHQYRLVSCCIRPDREIVLDDGDASMTSSGEEENEVEVKREGLANQSIWNQVKEIMMFTGPAAGLWIGGPLMSLIDTAVIGQGSSVELAALGPATVVCDYMSYIFMFLSVATSNMVATSLAGRDKNEVQRQISMLLFIGLTCGFLMLLFTRFFGAWALTAFTGSKNAHIVPAANSYVQIRGLAWPAILVGWIAQSASLGMKDSWGPLKALLVSSVINGVGDIVLCIFLGYGIAGAAWATMISQVVAAYMMIQALNEKGYNAFAIAIPSLNELLTILGLAAPVFVTMMSKIVFYSLLIYFATSMGTHTVAAHQVMIQTYGMFNVWGEPLSQTAQSFMPELLYGVKRSLPKARMLLKSLVTIGSTLGLLLGSIGTSVPYLFPNIFTHDQNVIQEMHKVLIPYFLALSVSSSTHSLEGTLLAGRDLKFISLSMSGCLALGALVLLLVRNTGYGLPGCWYALLGFQWSRFLLALGRLLSPNGILYSEDLSRYKVRKLKSA